MSEEQKQEQAQEGDAPEGAQQPSEAAKQAKAAADQAKAAAGQAMKAFKGFDPLGQLYIALLAVAFLCSLFFRVMSYDAEELASQGDLGELAALAAGMAAAMGDTINDQIPGLWHANGLGWLFTISVLGGIGLFIWANVSKQTMDWLPLAYLGCAGAAVLWCLIFWFASIDKGFDGTLLGFYLPFLLVIGATGVAFQRMNQPT